MNVTPAVKALNEAVEAFDRLTAFAYDRLSPLEIAGEIGADFVTPPNVWVAFMRLMEADLNLGAAGSLAPEGQARAIHVATPAAPVEKPLDCDGNS